jgi:hypothetical protein
MFAVNQKLNADEARASLGQTRVRWGYFAAIADDSVVFGKDMRAVLGLKFA